jgi:NAD(P)-dependent dehydrogenase (short-subunit alcohol dehydrogenase family)
VAAACGPGAAWFEADVTDHGALERALEGTLRRFGALDAVIANAGIAPLGSVVAIPPERFERTIEVNLLGVWRTVRLALPHLLERSGYVLAVASGYAAIHGPLVAHYCAAKAGVEAFADSLRMEVEPLGVDVGVAYFSYTDTDMVRRAFATPEGGALRRATPLALGRLVPVEAVGRAVADGVERRRRHVVVPGWLGPVLVGRGVLQPLLERALAGRFAEAVRIAGERAVDAPERDPVR